LPLTRGLVNTRPAGSLPRWWQETAGRGDRTAASLSAGLERLRFDPGRALALERWYLALDADGAARTRLYARSRTPRGAATVGYVLLFELPHFVMERKILLGIEQRVEQRRREGSR
jgi:hypothetical protein